MSSSRFALAPCSTERYPSALRPAPSAENLRDLTDNGAGRAHLWESIRWTAITSAFRRAGVELPRQHQGNVCSRATDSFQLNKPLQAAMSEYIRRVRPSFKDFTELLRGQTPDDYRPNKALLPFPLTQQCRGYPLLGELLVIASDGVRVRLWKPIPRQPRFPSNHPSSSARLNVLHKNIRKEQDLLLCLVVDAAIIKIWPEIVISPFGVVDKGDGDPQVTGRTIHDRSFPEDGSVNDCTDPANVPKASFEHCSRIAREIVRCKQENPECQIKVMAGDVASAYRNACIHSECVHLFGGHISEDDAIAIDLSAALGWSGSAGIYGVLGRAVAFRHGHNTNPGHPTGFFSYQWVDDHVNVAADTGSRCADIDRSLRFTMTAVMGPAAINEEKFTPWRTRQKVIGLIFDTLAATVTIPPAK